MKKIAVIFTGGTIGCISDADGRRLSGGQRYRLIDAYFARYGAREFVCRSPYTVLSENMDAEHLLMLATEVRDALAASDGVIVTHGTDTLTFTGAFLGYLFASSAKPICLVSSRAPIGETDANGVENFAAAVALIEDTAPHHGVFVPYRGEGAETPIFRATRLLPQPAYSDAVTALGGAYAVFNGKDVVISKAYEAKPDETRLDGIPSLLRKVLSVYPTVGQPYPSIPKGCAAILLHSYHSGTVGTECEALVAFLSMAKEQGIPVFLSGFSPELQYESMEKYATLGILPLPKISPIAAYIKLWLWVNLKGYDDLPFLPLGEDTVL